MKRKILSYHNLAYKLPTWFTVGAASMALTTAACAQGLVTFQNYNFGATSLNGPVTFGVTANVGGVNGVAGVGVGKEFTADLLYSFGGQSFSLLTAAQGYLGGPVPYPTPFAFGVGADGDAANFAGYFFGNEIQIPGYSSGPISFIVEAYTGSSYANADSWRGQSAPFTMSFIQSGTAMPSDFLGLSPFSVLPVPEPTVFALAGVGAATLMMARRKM